MITLSGSRVFFLLLLRFRLRLCFFFYSTPFSRTVEGNHCRMLKQICIFARCCHAPPPPSTRPASTRFFVLFVVNFLVVVLSVACNLFVYFWRRLHQIRQCRQAESFLLQSPAPVPLPPVSLLLCLFFASVSFMRVLQNFASKWRLLNVLPSLLAIRGQCVSLLG